MLLLLVTEAIKSPCALYSPVDLSNYVLARHVTAVVMPWERFALCSPRTAPGGV